MRLDPGGEWLCAGRVLQSERMLKNQLRDSKDVVAQSEAVRVRSAHAPFFFFSLAFITLLCIQYL